MSEAMISQFKRENDQLRKEVNQLHEKLFKIKGHNKQLKESNGERLEVEKVMKMYQKEKADKEKLMLLLNQQSKKQEIYHKRG